jgi:hypothetical protein
MWWKSGEIFSHHPVCYTSCRDHRHRGHSLVLWPCVPEAHSATTTHEVGVGGSVKLAL